MRRTLGALAAASLLALPGCGDGDDDLTAFCDQQAALEEATSSLSTDLLGDPAAAQESLEAAGTQIDELAASAPGEIKDDVELIADVFEDLTQQISDAESPQDVAALLEGLQTNATEIEEAGTNIDAFIAENCDESG